MEVLLLYLHDQQCADVRSTGSCLRLCSVDSELHATYVNMLGSVIATTSLWLGDKILIQISKIEIIISRGVEQWVKNFEYLLLRF